MMQVAARPTRATTMAAASCRSSCRVRAGSRAPLLRSQRRAAAPHSAVRTLCSADVQVADGSVSVVLLSGGKGTTIVAWNNPQIEEVGVREFTKKLRIDGYGLLM